MNSQLDIQSIERKAYQTFYQDGLMEILIGSLLLVAAVLLTAGSSFIWILAFSFFILKPLFEYLKKRITIPRIGYVKFHDDEQAAQGILKTLAISFAIMALLALVLISILGARQGWTLWLERVIPAIIGVLLAMGPLYAAGRYGLKHMIAISFLLVVSGFVIPFFGIGNVYEILALMFTISGAFSFIIGLILLIRFLVNHQVVNQEPSNDTL